MKKYQQRRGQFYFFKVPYRRQNLDFFFKKTALDAKRRLKDDLFGKKGVIATQVAYRQPCSLHWSGAELSPALEIWEIPEFGGFQEIAQKPAQKVLCNT